MILMLGTLPRIEEACRGGPDGSYICRSKQYLYASTYFLNSRGLLQDVAEGEQLLNVPLRLGIVDQAPEELGDDLLEVSRLAVQLLQERSLGESSQRYPWLQVRPLPCRPP
jgi:hypothetical protein